MSNQTTQWSEFDFVNLRDVSGALHQLGKSVDLPQPDVYNKDHLTPLLNFDRSRLSYPPSLSPGLEESIIELGRCSHRFLAVVLLEPTMGSRSTIDWIDFFLKVTSKGTLTVANTAILNARALLPNASFDNERIDNTNDARLVYNAVSQCLKILMPDSIIVCQCSVSRGMSNLVSNITRPYSCAGGLFFEMIGNKRTPIISAFHPSVFSKDDYQPQGRQIVQHRNADYKILPSRGAVLQAQLMEFCFALAINAICGYTVQGSGLPKLTAHIATSVAEDTERSKLTTTKSRETRNRPAGKPQGLDYNALSAAKLVTGLSFGHPPKMYVPARIIRLARGLAS